MVVKRWRDDEREGCEVEEWKEEGKRGVSRGEEGEE